MPKPYAAKRFSPFWLSPLILLNGHDDSSITLSGSNITAIANRGSIGGSLVQAIGAKQPTRLSSSSYFTGKSMNFSGAQWLEAPSMNLGSATNATVIIVSVLTGTAANFHHAFHRAVTTGGVPRILQCFRYNPSGDLRGEYADNGPTGTATTTNGAGVGVATRWMTTVDQTTSTNNVKIYTSGTFRAQASAAFSGTALGLSSIAMGAPAGGSSAWWIGEIPFVMMCDYILSAAQITQLDAWLAAEFF